MRNKIGGQFLLDLSMIALVIGQNASITNKEVLNQLQDLTAFIDPKRDFTKPASKNTKPVTIRYRSQASETDGVMYGQVCFFDTALKLLIGGVAPDTNGGLLSITIKVTYKWTDYIGYEVDSATLETTQKFGVIVDNVKTMSTETINALRCGDIVIKEDASGQHAYIVTYKGETGICLTYTDASCVETQSYDLVSDEWQYNSQDLTLLNKLENITDDNGHFRFIEGVADGNEVNDLTITYKKWSLSGTHLMIVVAGSGENGSVIGGLGNSKVFNFDIPEWIADKIVPTYGSTDIENKSVRFFASDGTSQSTTCYLGINKTTNKLQGALTSLTLTATRSFRLQFDLLIDND